MNISFLNDRRVRFFGVVLPVLLLVGLVGAGCDSNSSTNEEPLQQVRYDLTAQSNSGAVSGGVDGTITFWRVGESQTLATLELDDGATGASVSHPAHIHAGAVSEAPGGIQLYLSPLDGSGGGGTSARVIDRPIEELADFDGYVNIHESVASLGNIVSQGNIGANADGTEGGGLTLVDNPRSVTYPLAATSNSGSVAPSGLSGSVTFREVTDNITLVTLSLDTGGGATGADVSHPAHIHAGSVSEAPGGIQIYLSPVDGSDAAARSSKLVMRSYDDLSGFDGYVNVHESVANLGAIVSQGNIGANASGSSGGGDDGGGGGGGY
jgi:hypothetical protein